MLNQKIKKLKEKILAPYKDIFENFNNVFIFGTKQMGLKVAEVLEKNSILISGFIDNDLNKQGLKINNIKIVSPDEIVDKNAIILIATLTYSFEIEKQLKELGFKNIIPFVPLSLYYDDLAKFNQTINNLVDDVIKNEHEYNKLQDLFEDEISKQTLDYIIEYRKTLKTELFSKINQNRIQYFEKFLGDKIDVFVDGGGFDGDTSSCFIKKYPTYSKIYFFEPDVISLQKAQVNLKQFKNIEYLPYGISDKEEFLKFSASGDLGSFFSETGDLTIKCVALDEIIKEQKAFIKLDIEGSELAALKGATRLIKNNSTLAICVYHKPEDLYVIPNFILSLNDRYKFYLRHYSNSIFETVLYGVVVDD